MRKIPGYIEWLYSEETKREFPHLLFSADTDMVTMGMFSLTSVERPEVVVTMLTGDEWKNYNPLAVEKRINNELGRTDLRYIEFLRSVGGSGGDIRAFRKIAKKFKSFQTLDGRIRPGKDKAFSKFKKKYFPKKYYRDIYSPTGEATVVREESIEEFEINGGRVIRHKFDS